MKMNTLLTELWRRRACAGLALATAVVFMPALTPAADIQDLTALAQLEGPAYKSRRGTLLQSHPQPWDVSAAVAADWQAGLAAYVLNEWQRHTKIFADWDAVEPERAIGSYYSRHSATTAGADAQGFLLEQLWKTAIVPDWRNHAFKSLTEQRVLWATALSLALWQNAGTQELKLVGLYGLAGDLSTDARNVVSGILAVPKAHSAKTLITAISGLRHGPPPFATDLLLDSRAIWQTNAALADKAFESLAAQLEPRARSELLSIISDVTSKADVRATAIAAVAEQPQTNDLSVLRTLMSTKAPVELQRAVANAMWQYPISHSRSAIHQALRTVTDIDVLWQLLNALGSLGEADDLPVLREFAADPNRPEHLRTQANDEILSINRRNSP